MSASSILPADTLNMSFRKLLLLSSLFFFLYAKWELGTKLATMQAITVIFPLVVQYSKLTQENRQARCERTNGKTTNTGMTYRGLVGHSFKNFAVNKPFDYFVKCLH